MHGIAQRCQSVFFIWVSIQFLCVAENLNWWVTIQLLKAIILEAKWERKQVIKSLIAEFDNVAFLWFILSADWGTCQNAKPTVANCRVYFKSPKPFTIENCFLDSTS